MQIKLLLNYLVIALNANSVISAFVELTDDGPAVLDIPIAFNAILKGDVPLVNEFVYEFEDSRNGASVRTMATMRKQVLSGRTANITIVYRNVTVGQYSMRVQVFAYIWGFKGWFVAEVDHSFEIRNDALININISQIGVKSQALKDNIVCTNRTANLTAMIYGSQLLRNGSISYTWIIDTHTYKSSVLPYLMLNFTQNKTYKVTVIAMINVTEPTVNKTITKFGQSSKDITAKNGINAINVDGNTWLRHGALLHLDVNCTGGTKPFAYCWDIYLTEQTNYSCNSQDLIKIEKCNFRIIHYFPKKNTYYVEIGIENDIEFLSKTIQLHVYESDSRRPQLSFVIIPVVSSILAIIIVVVGVAYHLKQRQQYNITLEVADFDFQRTEDLNEKTFFGRLKESFSNSVRITLMHPCLSAQNYEDLIDDHSISPQLPANNNTDSIDCENIDTNNTKNIK